MSQHHHTIAYYSITNITICMHVYRSCAVSPTTKELADITLFLVVPLSADPSRLSNYTVQMFRDVRTEDPDIQSR